MHIDVLEGGEREISLRAMSIRLVWVIITVLSASAMWDYFVAQYRAVFELTLPTSSQQVFNRPILALRVVWDMLYHCFIRNVVHLC